MKRNARFNLLLLFVIFSFNGKTIAQKASNYISFKNEKEICDFFARKSDGSILISGHRGGWEAGYPENSIEGFQNVLNRIPAFFEIDPRLTKDSIIVLMHDAKLERTTTGKGKLSDCTYPELRDMRLKDHEGNVTSAKIPTLEEAIIWSKGKTVINLDKKDVPPDKIVALIKKHKAKKHVMLTVHTGAQARYYYDRLPGIMMSVFARNDREYEDIAISGVPWKYMIAYVGPAIDDSNRHIVEKLHGKGVRCMISFAPTHDKLETAKERQEAYREEIKKAPDIIESDLPTEVWKAIYTK
ncbi:MAG: glycerophosphodiester phosphodiesterase family protein [Tannerella sp.]|jgi:glycerophosphoryl diester phosphodiesterase|nr:glycerophosphodiester phosphodiesterase family protein [Tannerella sp.]